MPNQEQTKKIVDQLSQERFEACRYHGEDDESALRRVQWNTALSEALYTPLQGLEVSIRNSIHPAISGLFGGPDWILVPSAAYLRPSEQQMIEGAIVQLGIRGKAITPGYMISELKFGFWSSLFDVHYDKLWPKIIDRLGRSSLSEIRHYLRPDFRLFPPPARDLDLAPDPACGRSTRAKDQEQGKDRTQWTAATKVLRGRKWSRSTSCCCRML